MAWNKVQHVIATVGLLFSQIVFAYSILFLPSDSAGYTTLLVTIKVSLALSFLAYALYFMFTDATKQTLLQVSVRMAYLGGVVGFSYYLLKAAVGSGIDDASASSVVVLATALYLIVAFRGFPLQQRA